MNTDDHDARRRIAGPLEFEDLDGNGLAGQTFSHAGGELFTSIDGAAWVEAAADAAPVGFGFYRYPFSRGELAGLSFAAVLFRKAGYRDQSFREWLSPKVPGGAIAAGTLTTTTFQTDLAVLDIDFHKDAFVSFTSGDLGGQVKRIGGMSAGGLITLKSGYALTRAPTIGDLFDIICR